MRFLPMSDTSLPRIAWMGEEKDKLRFHCPGCGNSHYVDVKGDVVWGWNGSMVRPTFSPSVLTWDRRWVQDDPTDTSRVETEIPGVYKVGGPGHFEDVRRCHSFVTDGRIQFLSDCAHELVGQTVDLPDI